MKRGGRQQLKYYSAKSGHGVEDVPIPNIALCKSYSQREFSASYSKDYTLIVKVLTVMECQLSIEIHPNCPCPYIDSHYTHLGLVWQ